MSRTPMTSVQSKDIVDKINVVAESRKEVASYFGVTISAIAQWIRRERVPSDIWNTILLIHRDVREGELIDPQDIDLLRQRFGDRAAEGLQRYIDERFEESKKYNANLKLLNSSGFNMPKVLKQAKTEELVEELKERGWEVNLNKK